MSNLQEGYLIFWIISPLLVGGLVHWAIVPIQREILPWPVALWIFCVPCYLMAAVGTWLFFTA